MADQTQITVGKELRAKPSQLHGIYGRDQSLPQILDGLNKRLDQARLLYGPGGRCGDDAGPFFMILRPTN